MVLAHPAASHAGIATQTSSLRPSHYIIPSLAADLLGCISAYTGKADEQTRNKSRDGHVDTAHGETLLPPDCHPKVVKLMLRPFVLYRIQSENERTRAIRPPNWSVSSTIVASLSACNGILSPTSEHSRSFPLASNSNHHIGIRPIEHDNEASDSANWSQECGRLPTVLGCQWSSGEVHLMPSLSLRACNDRVVIHGKCVGSVSSSAHLICTDSYRWIYSQCKVRCVCNWAC